MLINKWRVGGNSSASRRRRPLRACDVCFTRKIQCDTAKPRCNWCTHQDLPCTFSRKTTRSRKAAASPPNSETPSPMTSTVSTGFSSLAATSSYSDRKSIPSIKNIQARSQESEKWAPDFAQSLQSATRHLGNTCTFDGTHVLSASSREWIKACTGEVFDLDRFPIEFPRWQYSASAMISNKETPSLPQLSVLQDEIKRYQSSTFELFFPIIDSSLIQHTINAAYYQKVSTESPTIAGARACIFAFHALAIIVLGGPDHLPFHASLQYAREAHQYFPDIFSEVATLDGIQAILLLSLCSQGLAGDFHSINHLLAAGSRLIYDLKGNFSPHMATDNPTAVHYHTRHLFWIAFVCDKGYSLVTGLPPMLEDSQCDLSFAMIPPGLLDQSNEKPHIFGDPYPGSYLHTYVRLAFIQSKIHRELYSPCALKQSNADLLRVIRDLDHSLEAWRNTIPIVSRPSLVAYTGNTIPTVDLRAPIFHVQYHHCMLMIHQASSRCDSWARNLDTQGTGSSLAISVTASRSLLGGFIHTPFELGSQNLLFSLSYFIQASINLFCKILSSPFDTENNEDVQIIAKISQLIESNLRPMDPECYTAKVRFAAGVTYELKRLAQCAIDNAGRPRHVTPRVTLDRHRGTPVPPS